jgi:catechol 2,3-dioxygenase-like lactoylglutathione lyase family enzyme
MGLFDPPSADRHERRSDLSDPYSTGPPLRADNLEFLRKQAKTLLKSARDGDADALHRLGNSLQLSSAQHAVARSAGFSSWPKLQDELLFREKIRVQHRLGSALPLQPGEKMSTDQSLKLGPIDQIGLTCTDLEEAQKFYCDILGLRLAADVPNSMKFFDCGGVNIIMFKADKISPNSCIYFQVPGEPGLIQEKVALLKSHNAKVESEAHVIARNWNGHDVWMAFFRDPFGNLLALKSHVPC